MFELFQSMFKRNTTLLTLKDNTQWLSKFEDAEKSRNFYCFYQTFHVLPSTKIIFMFQSAILFAYIVANFPCSILLLIFFALLCMSTIYSFYTCCDYFLLPLMSLLLTGHIVSLYIGLSVIILSYNNFYEKQVYGENFFTYLISNYFVKQFLSTNILFNLFKSIFLLLLSGLYIWQFSITWRCMKFFEIVKHHPTFCAVSMPPAYLSQLSLNSINDKNNSLISISVIGDENFGINNIKLYNNTFDENWLEIEQNDEEKEKFYKSMIDINLLL